MAGRIILTSRGLNTQTGKALIKKILRKIDAEDKILLITMAEYGINEILRNACAEMGFQKSNIFIYDGESKVDTDITFQYVYVSEGNTFELLDMIKRQGVMEIIKQNFLQGACYIGSSAGAMIAGSDIRLALDFDRNFVRMEDFTSLGLFDGTVIPHYTKAQFRKYYDQISQDLIAGYHIIYSISNEDAVIIENDGSMRSVRVRAM
jgi:dipeptidase E